jgi:hypothetical protein
MESMVIMNLPDPLGNPFGGTTPPANQVCPARILSIPERQALVSEKILIVQSQLFQAGACYVGQFQLHLFGGPRRSAAFGNILNTGPGRLDHLVMGSAPFIDVTVTESNGYVVNQLSDLKALKVPIAPVLWNQLTLPPARP